VHELALRNSNHKVCSKIRLQTKRFSNTITLKIIIKNSETYLTLNRFPYYLKHLDTVQNNLLYWHVSTEIPEIIENKQKKKRKNHGKTRPTDDQL